MKMKWQILTLSIQVREIVLSKISIWNKKNDFNPFADEEDVVEQTRRHKNAYFGDEKPAKQRKVEQIKPKESAGDDAEEEVSPKNYFFTEENDSNDGDNVTECSNVAKWWNKPIFEILNVILDDDMLGSYLRLSSFVSFQTYSNREFTLIRTNRKKYLANPPHSSG